MIMKNYKFLFDSQNGSYQGIVRAPFPENSTYVQPHFSVGYKTCWDFAGKWKLVKDEEFFKQIQVQDVLRDYDRDLERQCQSITKTISVLSNRAMKEFYSVSRSNVLEHHRTRSVLMNQNYALSEEIKLHLEGLQLAMIEIEKQNARILDLLTLGPVRRYLQRLKAWLKQ